MRKSRTPCKSIFMSGIVGKGLGPLSGMVSSLVKMDW